MAVAKLTMTWVGLPPALSENFLLGRRQPWRFLGFYGSTSGGRELTSGWERGPRGGGASRGRGLSAGARLRESHSLGTRRSRNGDAISGPVGRGLGSLNTGRGFQPQLQLASLI